MLPCPASTLSFSYICIAQNLKPNQFCKKLAEVIVILNRASSIDKHTKKKSQNTCLSLLLRELFLRNSSNNASSLAINPSLTFFCFNLGVLDSGIVLLKTGLDRASTVGKLGYWTSRASEIRRQRRCAWRYAFHFTRSVHNYSSIHVCKQNQNYSSRAHCRQEY